MIPVSLYGISVERCEDFFRQLPELVANLHDDRAYTDTLFAIDDGITIEKLHRIDSWANFGPQAWPEDVIRLVSGSNNMCCLFRKLHPA